MNTPRALLLTLLMLAPLPLMAATPLHVAAALDRGIIEPLLAEFATGTSGYRTALSGPFHSGS